MMVDHPLHLTRPPQIPVVFNSLKDLLAVADLAVKELRRKELPRLILYRDEPTLLAIVSIVDKWGLWAMLMH
jgi:hypothetical protein